MKILLVAENWPPRVGGIERYLTGLTKELAKEHEVTVLAPRSVIPVSEPESSPSAAESGSRITSGMTGKLSVIRKKFFWPFIRPAWLPLYIFIYRLAQKESFDIVLCGKGLFEGLVGYYLKKRLNVPYVVFTYAMEIAQWQKRSRTRRKLLRALTHAKKVVVINDVTKRTLVDLGVMEKNIVRIYPAVDNTFLSRLTNTEAHQKVLASYAIQKPYILSVGRLISRKGFDDLIRAFAKLDQTRFGDVDLVIVGDGPERAHLEKIAEQEFVRPLFLTDVPDVDLPALFSQAALFALTPKEIEGDIEGFGIVYLEAAAAGIPTVGTKTGGVPEAVADGTTGLLAESGDIDDVAKDMTRLLQDPDLAQRLGAAGRKRVQDMFTWKQQSSSLLEEIRKHASVRPS